MLIGAPANSQTSMTSQQAQAVLQRHADAGKIVILYGAVDGSYLLERPATGIISTNRCSTDFAAPRPTRLMNITNPATHFNVVWSYLQNVRINGEAISFNSSDIGPDKFAKLVVSDSAARAEVWQAIQTLARNCGADTTAPVQNTAAQPVAAAIKDVRPATSSASSPAVAQARWTTKRLPGTTTKTCQSGSGDPWRIELTEGTPLRGKDGRDLSFKSTVRMQYVQSVGISAQLLFDGPVTGAGRARLASVFLDVPWDKDMARLDIHVDERRFKSWDDDNDAGLMALYDKEIEDGAPPGRYEWEPDDEAAFIARFATGKKLSARAIGAKGEVIGSWFSLDLNVFRDKIAEIERMNWKCPG